MNTRCSLFVPATCGGPCGERNLILASRWSEWQDLNLRPPRPERGAQSPEKRQREPVRVREHPIVQDG
jgi:hypothetical protein